MAEVRCCDFGEEAWGRGTSQALELSKHRPHTGGLTICEGLGNAFISLDSMEKGCAGSHHLLGCDNYVSQHVHDDCSLIWPPHLSLYIRGT